MSMTRAALAKAFNISERSLDMAAKVRRYGIPELESAIMAGELKLWPAYLLSAETPERQREILASMPPRKIASYLKSERSAAANLRRPEACSHCHGTGIEPAGGAA